MNTGIRPVLLLIVGCWLAAAGTSRLYAQLTDAINEATEQALKAAASRVAPSVVQIETTGGAETIGGGRTSRGFRKGIGPTTGLIVTADGFVVSSAFNFAQKPASILVSVPGRRERFIARIVATDQTRMVTLLKIDATDLPVAQMAAKRDIQIGQWTAALGRALDANLDRPPAISVGVVSALARIYGKAIQTDAKISPTNYGGPLVDLDGRVVGLLVPAAPRGESETAGVEWYDSGIGFAIPMDDILAVLPRLKQGQNLKRGLLGVTFKGRDQHSAPPVVATVAQDSAAAKAGLRVGDAITALDEMTIGNQSHLQHALGPKYEGDSVRLRVRRGAEDVVVDRIVLGGAVTAQASAQLGIVVVRDDPEVGVEVRWVEPNGPADRAGIRAGDRLMKLGDGDAKELRGFSGRDELRQALDAFVVGAEIKIELKRKGGEKVETVTAKLAAPSDTVPDALPANASAARALEPRRPAGLPKPEDKKPEKPAPKPEEKRPATGLTERATPAKDRSYWVYVPSNYDPNVSHALVIWLHAAGQRGKDAQDLTAIWRDFCERHHIILVGPKSESESGWLASESEFIDECAREVMREYAIDRDCVVAHGVGAGGQMAFYLGFVARDVVRGVATFGAAFAADPKDAVRGQPLAFFIVAGAKDIAESRSRLVEKKYPVVVREVADAGRDYFDRPTLEELIRWLDSLDRL